MTLESSRARLHIGRHGLALLGLAVAMSLLAAVAIGLVMHTSRAEQRASAAVRLSDTYQRARFAVGEEESLERKYRLEPSAAVRSRHARAARELVAALRIVERSGERSDRELCETLLVLHGRYLGAIERMFGSVDRGDRKRVLEIDSNDVDPLFEQLESDVNREAQTHREVALSSLESLRRSKRTVVTLTAIAFGIGLGFLMFFAAVLSRVHRQLERHARRAEHDASHDPLTELPNRVLFEDLLAEAIRDGASCSVLMISLNRFKSINDTLGRATGDAALRTLAARLSEAVRADDTLARLGSDEFAVLLPATGTETATELAESLLAVAREPLTLADLTLVLDATIGIVSYPLHGEDADMLIQHADVALHLAKQQGSTHAIYTPNTEEHGAGRLTLAGELRRALADDELELHYQPKFTIADRSVSGVEALARWRHPERGLVAPGEFIPLAEQTGLIGPLTLIVLRKAARQYRAWRDAGLDLTIAVNLSVANLLDRELVHKIDRVLREEDMPPSRLELEITESTIMTDPDRAIELLDQLAAMGVRLALDDFGTGHSSLSYLQLFNVHELKIDRSFLLDLSHDAAKREIVRATITLAHSLGLRVVAEGIEDAETLPLLAQMRCDRAQGFYLCRPIPADAIVAELDHHARRTTVHPAPVRTPWLASISHGSDQRG